MPHLPSASPVGIINGGVEALSPSPLSLPPCSSSPLSLSPVESPLTVGSFLEQRARLLFRPTNRSQEEEEQLEGLELEDEEDTALPESLPVGLEAEEATLLTGVPLTEPQVSSLSGSGAPAPPADLAIAVCQRRHELSIMDYDEMLPEY